MGKDNKKKSAAQRKLNGNPSGRDIPDEVPVGAPPKTAPAYLKNGREKQYWNLWAGPLIDAGRLTEMTVPAFIDFIQMKVRLDEINDELRDVDGGTASANLIQDVHYVDSAGKLCTTSKESAHSKLSRDLTVTVTRLMGMWGLLASSVGVFKPKGPKKRPEEELLDD
jgi:hypothetical protein